MNLTVKRISLIIAILALFQPWILKGVENYLYKGNIAVIETGRIAISHHSTGPVIFLRGTLRTINEQQFVERIKLSIERYDGAKHIFEPDVYIYPRSTITSAPDVYGLYRSKKYEESVLRLPYPFVIINNQSYDYYIKFYDITANDRIKQHLSDLNNAWKEKLDSKIISAIREDNKYNKLNTKQLKQIKDTFEIFSKEAPFLQTNKKISEEWFWKPGKYILYMNIITSDKKEGFPKKWFFEIKKEDSDTIEKNLPIILADYILDSNKQLHSINVDYLNN